MAKSPKLVSRTPLTLHDTITPLERHRLEMFYADGPESFEQAMKLRELMAMLQHQSPTPIRPYEVLKEHLEKSLGTLEDQPDS